MGYSPNIHPIHQTPNLRENAQVHQTRLSSLVALDDELHISCQGLILACIYRTIHRSSQKIEPPQDCSPGIFVAKSWRDVLSEVELGVVGRG